MITQQYIKKEIKKAVKNSPHQKDIKKISIFGSYVNGKPNRNSDIDLIIEFRPRADIGLFEFVTIQNDFSKNLKKPVDLLTKDSISKYFRKQVLKQAKTIYER